MHCNMQRGQFSSIPCINVTRWLQGTKESYFFKNFPLKPQYMLYCSEITLTIELSSSFLGTKLLLSECVIWFLKICLP